MTTNLTRSRAEFGETVNAIGQLKIKAAIDNSIIYMGAEIEAATEYVADKKLMALCFIIFLL